MLKGRKSLSAIQRLYSLLKDEPLDEAAEEANPAEQLRPVIATVAGLGERLCRELAVLSWITVAWRIYIIKQGVESELPLKVLPSRYR